MNEKFLQEKLKLINYDLLMARSPKSKENFYEELSTRINTLLETVFFGIYLYDCWNKCFSLVSGKESPIKNSVQDHHNYYQETMKNGNAQISAEEILSEKVDGDIITLSINPEFGPIVLLVIGLEPNKNLTNDVLDIIRDEMENIFSFIFRIDRIKDNEEKHLLLYEMTSKFLVLNNKADILKEIISNIKNLYPNVEFNLLLSQDHDETIGLPVKSIELNDQSLELASSKAFLTGEVQLEYTSDEQCTTIYAPLKGNQGIYGVLEMKAHNALQLPKEEIELITNFATTVGKALESTTLYQYSKHQVSDLKLINDLTHKLNSNLELTEITRLMKDQIIKICQPEEIGFVYQMQENSNHFEVLEGSTDYFETIEGRGFIRSLVDDLIQQKEALFSVEYTSNNKSNSYKSIMALPMMNAGTLIGMVVVVHSQSHQFSFDQFKLLQSIIHHSTLAFVNTILKEQLLKAASTDYLTQLYNRNYFDEKIMQHMKIGEMGSLILFDIDNFKKINDTYGHYVGDEVIKQVANIIMSNIEERDIAARWGGEELAVYLPSTGLNESVHIARTISTQVENFTEPRVTLSAGVSTWDASVEDSARNFFIRADKALYEAKSYGKNCVVKYSLPDEKTESLH